MWYELGICGGFLSYHFNFMIVKLTYFLVISLMQFKARILNLVIQYSPWSLITSDSAASSTPPQPFL